MFPPTSLQKNNNELWDNIENEKKNDLCGNKVVYKIKIDPYEVDLV